MRGAAIIIVSILLFLGAAKWHGMQLRHERERAVLIAAVLRAPSVSFVIAGVMSVIRQGPSR